jgi:3'-phosphoadenosine 5'-phosphosulfate sulfotransferase (PAPS reductase)/FAD synthetase
MSPEEILQRAQQEYPPKKTFALFSGGYDSLSVTHWAMNNGADAVVHVNTGIGIEETRQFVRETCQAYDWPLLEYHPPVSFESLVLKYGFPGPAGHRYMYTFLKERCIRQLVRDHKEHRMDKIHLITGVRLQESQRRMGNAQAIQKNGAQIWVAPFLAKSKADVLRYVQENELPRNPVVDHLHMSGECLCGAYAHKGELEEIRLWYPETAERIEALEREVAEAGFPWRWEDPGPPKGWKKGFPQTGHMGPLCSSCTKQEASHVNS